MNQHKKGFTLIELLVVIAIIALLLAILMPSLQKAKELGKMVVCMSNQKSLLISWKTYNADNNGQLVNGNTNRFGTLEDDEHNWVEPPVRLTTIGSVNTGGNATTPTILEHELNGIRGGALWSFLEDIDVYRCPSDNRLKIRGNAQPSSFRSYSIVATMNGEKYSFLSDYTVVKESQILNSSSKFVFMDDFDARSFNMGSWIFQYDINGDHRFFDPIAVWHYKKCNFSYADGHAESRVWQDTRTHKYARYRVFGKLEDQITNDQACDNGNFNEDVLFLARGFKAH